MIHAFPKPRKKELSFLERYLERPAEVVHSKLKGSKLESTAELGLKGAKKVTEFFKEDSLLRKFEKGVTKYAGPIGTAAIGVTEAAGLYADRRRETESFRDISRQEGYLSEFSGVTPEQQVIVEKQKFKRLEDKREFTVSGMAGKVGGSVLSTYGSYLQNRERGYGEIFKNIVTGEGGTSNLASTFATGAALYTGTKTLGLGIKGLGLGFKLGRATFRGVTGI